MSDLSPLKGMPLTILSCNDSRVSDLSPLKDMKLTGLDCTQTLVSDLSPLRDMPLKWILCDFKPERDAEILRSIKTLETINLKPAAEFWKDVSAAPASPVDDAWLKAVAAMPAEKQVQAVMDKLKELNPGFDSAETHLTGNPRVVTDLQFLTDKVTDISPVRALTGLRSLTCNGSGVPNRFTDLSPLKDLKLTNLSCAATAVSDLSPLKGMPLGFLDCVGTAVSDLSPLKGMPLYNLNVSGTKVSDLSPVKGMPLKFLTCDFKPERDAEILRSIPTLETINFKPAKEFWKEVDASKPHMKP